MCAFLFFFFFNDTATTEIYTLSLTTLFRSARSRSWPRSRACGAGGRRRSAAKSLQPSAARERLTPRMDWRANLVDDDAGIARILREARTIAVLGAKGEPTQPAYYVPAYLKARGYRVLPVNPTRTDEPILGEAVAATLADLREPADVVE